MKTAIVTGASRGIGYQTCISLAKQQCNVIAAARSVSPLENLSGLYPEFISAFPADLTSAEDIEKLSEFAAEQSDSIDILINNAGALINKPFEELNPEDWQHMLDINLLANVNLTKSLLPRFSSPAHIVNISSMGGFQGSQKFPGLSAYSVAKGAVNILSECLAAELSSRQIHVNALCPGAVQTGMLEEAFPEFEAPVSAKNMGKYIAGFALTGSAFYNGRILPVAKSSP